MRLPSARMQRVPVQRRFARKREELIKFCNEAPFQTSTILAAEPANLPVRGPSAYSGMVVQPTNFPVRGPSAYSGMVARSAHPTAERQGVDQFTVNERDASRNTPRHVFDESLYSTPLDHSQLSTAQHAKAERTAGNIEAFVDERGRSNNDEMDDEVDDHRSPLAERTPPGFEALGSDASMAAPPSDVDDQHDSLPLKLAARTNPADTPAATSKRASASPPCFWRALSCVVMALSFLLAFGFTVMTDDEVRRAR